MTTTPARTYEHAFQSFGLRENPFQGSPDPRFFFAGRSYETTLSEIGAGIEGRRGLLVLTGEPGTGKTTLVRRFLEWLGSKKISTSYVFHSHLNSAGLFEFILKDFGIRAESTKKSEMLAALQEFLQGRQAQGDSPVVIIDEAQALSVRALSELCLLLNLETSGGKLLQIVLVGQTELDEKLRRPELRQLRQRIAVRCRLPLLSLEETEEYIGARLRCAGGTSDEGRLFPSQTLEALYAYAQGVPRVTNLLCEKALLATYAQRQSVVTPASVRRVAAEFDFAFDPHSSPATMPEMRLRTSTVIPLDAPSNAAPVTEPPMEVAAPAGMESTAEMEMPLAAVPSVEPVVETVLQLPALPLKTLPPEPKAKPNVTVFVPKEADPEPVPATVDAAPEATIPVAATAEAAAPPRVHYRHRPETAFHRYWREVADSFVRDWRHFLGAFQTQTAPDGKVLFMKKYDLKRDLVAPVSRWLSRPMPVKPGNKEEAKARQAGRGTF